MNEPTTLSSQVSSRLLWVFLTGWVFIAILVALGLISLYITDQGYTRALQAAEEVKDNAAQFNSALISEVLHTRAYLLSNEPADLTQRQLAHDEVIRQLSLLQEQLPDMGNSSLGYLAELHTRYDSVADEMIRLRQDGEFVEAIRMFNAESDPLVAEVLRTGQLVNNEIERSMLAVSRQYTQYTTRAIFAVAAAFLVGTGFSGLAAIRSVTPPLRTLENLETNLIASAQAGQYRPLSPNDSPLVDAYNRMVRRLEESSATALGYMDRFAHDMNSLLAAVHGYANVVADPAMRSQSDEIAEFGQLIVQQVRRLAALVADGQLGAKIASNRYQVHLAPTRLQPLLAALAEEHCRASGREIRLEMAPNVPLVLTDPLSLRDAVERLLDNAVKFSPNYSTVTLACTAGQPAGQVTIRIRDEGCGIAAEELGQLFHPFTKFRGESTRHIPGNGMGLYIARAIISAQHGSLTLESQPGGGTTAVIRLPVEGK